MLRLVRPVRMILHVTSVMANNLLQEHDIRTHQTQPIAQIVHHHAAIEVGKTFVNVVGGDGQCARISMSQHVVRLAHSQQSQ